MSWIWALKYYCTKLVKHIYIEFSSKKNKLLQGHQSMRTGDKFFLNSCILDEALILYPPYVPREQVSHQKKKKTSVFYFV